MFSRTQVLDGGISFRIHFHRQIWSRLQSNRFRRAMLSRESCLVGYDALVQIEAAVDSDAEIVVPTPREPASRHRQKFIERDVEVDRQHAELVCVNDDAGLADLIGDDA
jgi:hypothetical protein